MNNGLGFQISLPDEAIIYVGVENGMRTLRNGDICPFGATFLGMKMTTPVAKQSYTNYSGMMFYIGLGFFVYNKFGAGAVCLTGLAMVVLQMILRNSFAVAKQRAASSAQSAASTAASSATRREPTP